MWVEGPTQLDTPVLVFGFEAEDLAFMMGVMLLSGLFFEGMAGVCVVTACAGLLLRRLKRGRPPGALIHVAHQLELIRIPGAVRPQARRWSPSAAEEFVDC